MGRETKTDREGELHRATGEAEAAGGPFVTLTNPRFTGLGHCPACKAFYHSGTDHRCPLCGTIGLEVVTGRLWSWSYRLARPRHQDAPQGPGDRPDES